MKTAFTELAKVEVPLICGAMYPCTNPELVAAVSEAGGLGVVQPLSMTFVYKWDLREGLKKIRAITQKPYGFNVLTEASSRAYIEKNKKWMDIAIEEGCRFFITALGNPTWIVQRAKAVGAVVFHDVTERKWALKAIDCEVDGLICVNNRAGGHTGALSPQELYEQLHDLGKPLVCAGGVGNAEQFAEMIRLGYSAVQMGTRFIATKECGAHDDYKQAILASESKDIVLTDKLSGVPVSILNTPAAQKMGITAGPVARWFLDHPRFKHWMRLYYLLMSATRLKKAHLKGTSGGGRYSDFWQAGKSVDGIEAIESAGDIVRKFKRGLTTS